MIGFGLVAIPIQLYKAMDDDKITMHLLHVVCGSRIQYRKHCPVCDVDVQPDDVVRGVELPDGRYVILQPDEDSQTSADRTINLVSFHQLGEIDPVLYRQAYWVKPLPGGEKAYRLLTDTLQETRTVGLATMTLRQKFSLSVIRPVPPHVLMLHSLYFPESLREEGRTFGQTTAVISEKERDMAKMLVTQMQEPFVEENYPNLARRELLERIEALAPNAQPAPDARVTKEVLSLMEQLRSSVEQRTQREHQA
ncbi:Ku domain-containing protein [Sulfobacillus thermotolerans]|uniref:Ku domain-containing protein n=1 Tax=Sulfobacillus thermotolerans TaxID=338644 RepID=A0ABN5H8M8_9FIRM|nr:Ku domain-containing protein [Sulfobacillus thermotolerans]